MISCVKRAKCSVASGRKANMCQICGYSAPTDCAMRISLSYLPGSGLASTPGKNIGFIAVFVSYRRLAERAAKAGRRPPPNAPFGPRVVTDHPGSGAPPDCPLHPGADGPHPGSGGRPAAVTLHELARRQPTAAPCQTSTRTAVERRQTAV